MLRYLSLADWPLATALLVTALLVALILAMALLAHFLMVAERFHAPGPSMTADNVVPAFVENRPTRIPLAASESSPQAPYVRCRAVEGVPCPSKAKVRCFWIDGVAWSRVSEEYFPFYLCEAHIHLHDPARHPPINPSLFADRVPVPSAAAH